MTNKLIYFCLILMIIQISFIAGAGEVIAQPVVEWSPSFFDVQLLFDSEMDTTLILSNEGDEPLSYELTISFVDTLNWLIATPDSGLILPNEAEHIQLSFATFGLYPGIYYAFINLITNDPLHPEIEIVVVLQVVNDGECQLILPNGGFVTATVYQESDTTLSFFILNIGDSACYYQAISMDNWLSVAPDTGWIMPNSSQPIVLTIDGMTLDDGLQTGYVQFIDRANHVYVLTVEVMVVPVCLRPIVMAEQIEAEVHFTIHVQESGIDPILARVWQRLNDGNWVFRYSQPVIDSVSIVMYLNPEVENWFRFQTVCEENHGSVYVELGPFIYPMGVSDMSTINVPARNGLLPNFPNPFNPQTTIRYQLAHQTDVTLSIYDMKGQLVKYWSNHHPKNTISSMAGVHSVLWDGTDEDNRSLPSGIYGVLLRTNKNQWTQKIVLVR